MKFSQEILIDLPRERVVNIIEDPSLYRFWQRDFISYKHLSGQPGKEGSKSRMKFKWKDREIDIIQTILLINLPKKIFVTYETKGIFTTQKNYFEKVTENNTRWITDIECRFTGYRKIAGFYNLGKIKKLSQLIMQDFKSYAENEKKVME